MYLPRVPSAALTLRYLSITSRRNWCTCWSTTPTTWERMATGHVTALLWGRKAWASALARSQLCTRDLSGRRARRMEGVTRRRLWLKETKLEQIQEKMRRIQSRPRPGWCREGSHGSEQDVAGVRGGDTRGPGVCGVNVWFSGSFRWLRVKHLVSLNYDFISIYSKPLRARGPEPHLLQ